MKKLHFIIIAIILVNLSFAQESDFERTEDIPLHEVKINAGLLLLGNAEITYENLLNNESSIGASVSFPFDDFVSWDLQFSATGFYRFYFGDNYADGIFAEGFGMFNIYDERLRRTPPDGEPFRENESVADFAFGVGGGYKLVSKGGVTFEINGGVGRNMFNYGKDGRTFNFVPRMGIHVGYRF